MAMLQAAGHAGTLKQDTSTKGFILKPFEEAEAQNYEALWNNDDEPLQKFVARWGGVSEILIGSEETGEKKQFMRLGNLLEQFKKPCVMDCKMGVRTFQEKEAQGNKPREDLYKRLEVLNPEYISEEEHKAGSITKFKWMSCRDAASTSKECGLRVDGIVSEQGARIEKKVLDKFVSRDELLHALPLVLPLQFVSEEGGKACVKRQRVNLMQQIIEQLDELRTAMENSDFVKTHEFVGASLLFVVDPNLARVHLIDLAKTEACPAGTELNHRTEWVMGNHEDGILMGMDSLLDLWKTNLKYFEEHGCFMQRLGGAALRELQLKLHSYSVDTSTWGKDGAKSLEELYSEINEEKAVTFEVSEDGRFFRVMDVIKAWIMVEVNGKRIALTEPRKHSKHSDKESDTSKRPKSKPLQRKVTVGQDWRETVQQAITQRLGIEPDKQPHVFEMMWKSYERNTEVRKGTKDDGFTDLWSKYRVHEIDIRINDPNHPMLRPLGLPEGTSFTTMQSGGMHSAFGHRQHSWQWVDVQNTNYEQRNNEDYAEFTITLNKKGKEDALGVGWQRSQHCEEGVMLIGQFAKEGLMPTWNIENPHSCTKVGDRIVEVNGIKGNFDVLLAEMQIASTLRILISRVPVDIDPTVSESFNLQQEFHIGRPSGYADEKPKMKASDAGRVLVLDCGSGSTRGSFYSVNHDGSLCEEILKPKMDPVHTVIAAGATATQTFLDQLSVIIGKSGKQPSAIILGACGGLRDAIEDGKVTTDMVTAFREALHTQTNGIGVLRTLTGEDEAHFEHTAVQYMAKMVLPSLTEPVGLISSGGTSSQLVYFPDGTSGKAKQFSLHTIFKSHQLKIIEVGVEEGLKSLDQSLEELLTRTVPDLLGQLRGVFCCIETMGQIGEVTDCGHKLISKDEAVAAITACLEEYKTKNKGIVPKDAGWTYKDTFRGAMPVLALRLLQLLHPSAQLYFADHWKLSPGHTMQAVVPLGLYLESVDF